MKKFFKIIAIIYITFGIFIAGFFYLGDVTTYDCVSGQESTTIGGSFINPDPTNCTRRGFTADALTGIPINIIFGPLLVLLQF